MRWVVLYCAVLLVYSKTEIEINIEQNVGNCFVETFGLSESSWNNINAQENFVQSLQNCLKTKNMLQISDNVLQDVNMVAGNLTLEASNVNTALVTYKQFSESFHATFIDRIDRIHSYVLSASSFYTESFKQSISSTKQQRADLMVDYLASLQETSYNVRQNLRVLLNSLKTFKDTNLPLYRQYLSDYTTKKDNFKVIVEEKNSVQSLILQDVLAHVNARLTRQRFQTNCIEGQEWLQCTNDFQHVNECYRPARVYHHGQIIAVNSSIEIGDNTFCSDNMVCVYTQKGFMCQASGSEIPNVVYHSSNGFGRSYDVLHRYGTFDISFFTLHKLKQMGVETMNVESLGTIGHTEFNTYIYGLYDQLE